MLVHHKNISCDSLVYKSLFKTLTSSGTSEDYAQIVIAVFGGFLQQVTTRIMMINRPGVAGAALQTASSLAESAFSSRYSQHHKSQTVRARQLKF